MDKTDGYLLISDDVERGWQRRPQYQMFCEEPCITGAVQDAFGTETIEKCQGGIHGVASQPGEALMDDGADRRFMVGDLPGDAQEPVQP